MEQRRFSGSRASGSRTHFGGRNTSGRPGGFSRGGSRDGARGGSRSDSRNATGYRPRGHTSSQGDSRSTNGYSGGNSYARGNSDAGYAPRTSTTPTRPPYAGSGTRPASRGYEGTNPRSDSRFGGRQGGFSRPGFGGNRSGGFSRGGSSRSGSRRGPADERIDPSKFINKAVITEEIEHFVPEHAFSDFKIGADLKASIAKKGYVHPTPIQDRSIPHTLQGVDVVGIANTGTGKTGAFLIPLLNKVLLNTQEAVLIVVPTRELALQIEEELQGFLGSLRHIRSVCCFGGANISRQIEALRSHRHFVIGTPGRLKDLLERRKLNLSGFKTVVLDEADRMLDMGFVHDMRTIIGQMPKERQTLFFSATISPEVEKLISEFLNEPVRISVKTRDTSKNIDQDVIYVERGGSKLDALAALLKKPEFSRVLVFGRTKHGVDKLAKSLSQSGIATESIHGNKNNSKRQLALRLFKMGKVRVLVATDVAARGLDISDVTHVINFDLPATYNDYVHRIGRTGRGNKKGVALTLIER